MKMANLYLNQYLIKIICKMWTRLLLFFKYDDTLLFGFGVTESV